MKTLVPKCIKCDFNSIGNAPKHGSIYNVSLCEQDNVSMLF